MGNWNMAFVASLVCPGVAAQYSSTNKRKGTLGNFMEGWVATRRDVGGDDEKRQVLIVKLAQLVASMMGPLTQVRTLNCKVQWQNGREVNLRILRAYLEPLGAASRFANLPCRPKVSDN